MRHLQDSLLESILELVIQVVFFNFSANNLASNYNKFILD